MSAPKFIDIEGRRFLWRDIVKLRQEQRRAAAKAEQPPLFELRDDCRPATERAPPQAATANRRCFRFSAFDPEGSRHGGNGTPPLPAHQNRQEATHDDADHWLPAILR
jgi:hypothetical protein